MNYILKFYFWEKVDKAITKQIKELLTIMQKDARLYIDNSFVKNDSWFVFLDIPNDVIYENVMYELKQILNKDKSILLTVFETK